MMEQNNLKRKLETPSNEAAEAADAANILTPPAAKKSNRIHCHLGCNIDKGFNKLTSFYLHAKKEHLNQVPML
jgi:hypothetical protein